MDVMRLTNANAMRNMEVPVGKERVSGKASLPKAKAAPLPKVKNEVTERQVQAILDRLIKNTRFQYDISNKVGYFVVKIIDQDTNKVIREIPSPELQKVHDGIEQALGILFDEKI